jgi:predicted nucleotidyltransferase
MTDFTKTLSGRKFKDRDFVQTIEGLIFCTVGYLHPNNRVIGFLKYIQNPKGKWGSNQRYSRSLPYYHVRFVKDSLSNLKKNYPDYVWFSPVHQQYLPSVPYNQIKHAFFPEQYPKILSSSKSLSALDKKALEFISTLSSQSNIPPEVFGITGSILLGIANPKFSDLNITFQGRNNIKQIKLALTDLIQSSSKGFDIVDPKKNEKWIQNRAKHFPLTYDEFLELRKRKWNNGSFKGTFFSLTPILQDDEINNNYGDQEFFPLTPIKLHATVLDDTDASYNPAIYKIRTEKIITPRKSKINLKCIKTIISYEGLYASYPQPGEQIEVYGMLEQIKSPSDTKIDFRVVLGTTKLGNQEYMRIL